VFVDRVLRAIIKPRRDEKQKTGRKIIMGNLMTLYFT
jgi:hypothetical protein